jgi:hypothetical protein
MCRQQLDPDRGGTGPQVAIDALARAAELPDYRRREVGSNAAFSP